MPTLIYSPEWLDDGTAVPWCVSFSHPTLGKCKEHYSLEGDARARLAVLKTAVALDDIRNGRRDGITLSASLAEVNLPSGDIVSLLSKNVSRAALILPSLLAFVSECGHIPGVVFGVFALDAGRVSLDCNAVVFPEHRASTLRFAQFNRQVAIWDAGAGVAVPTGGDGEGTLKSPRMARLALPRLLAGTWPSLQIAGT